MTRTLQAVSLPLALIAAATPTFAHPGPHTEATLGESLAHVASSADHLAALTFAALCALAGLAARAAWTRAHIARARATEKSRSTRS